MIEFHNVTKIYRPSLPLRREVRAVEEFSLRIVPGEVLGIAGPNGAGKSTLLALLLGYLKPTSGRVTIDGHAPRDYIERNGIGYMSELIAIPPGWTTDSALVRYALLAGLPERELRPRVNAVMEMLGLDEHRSKKTRHLSKGTLQRLGLAEALLREERIIVLDEPTHGLDPVWTQRFRDLVQRLRHAERAILIASHNLDELERVADRVAIIDRGRLQRTVDTRAATRSMIVTRYRLALAAGHEHVAELFGEAREVAGGELEVLVRDVHELNRAIAELIARGGLVTAVAPAYSGLEQQFREAIGERLT